MDNQRPQLDLKFYKDICPDQNGALLWTFITGFTVTHRFEVPVIVLFTKHDQFLRNIAIHVSDYPKEYLDSNVSEVAEKVFQEYYMHPLGDGIRFVQLKSGFSVKYQEYADVLWQKCTCKIVAVMILLRRHLQGWMMMLFHWCFSLCRRIIYNWVLMQRWTGECDSSVQVEGVKLCNDFNKHCSVNPHTGSKAYYIIRECLFSFPYIWVSVNSILKLYCIPYGAWLPNF